MERQLGQKLWECEVVMIQKRKRKTCVLVSDRINIEVTSLPVQGCQKHVYS